MLNFGALIAFMGVNLAAFLRYNVRDGKQSPVIPAILTAIVVIVAALPNPPTPAWIAAGIALAFLAVWTPPLAGFSICFFLWRNLSLKAWIVGGIWMIVGIAFGAIKTRGFRGDLVDFELPAEEN